MRVASRRAYSPTEIQNSPFATIRQRIETLRHCPTGNIERFGVNARLLLI
ncbi:MAG: hypothetical protein KJ622_17650 [Alphaproteobacteria bacterium]|nr:hypothetical protein [Alphaproteobacteria bacterium]